MRALRGRGLILGVLAGRQHAPNRQRHGRDRPEELMPRILYQDPLTQGDAGNAGSSMTQLLGLQGLQ